MRQRRRARREVTSNWWWELFDANEDKAFTSRDQSYAEQLARSIHGHHPKLSLTALMILCQALWEEAIR
jgi:hypothetical protein